MTTELRYKVWLIETAAKFQVKCDTVRRWYERGLFHNLKIRRVNPRIVYISGDTDIHLHGPGLHKTYDFSNVDWRKPNCVIAAELGCHQSLVSIRRKQSLQSQPKTINACASHL